MEVTDLSNLPPEVLQQIEQLKRDPRAADEYLDWIGAYCCVPHFYQFVGMGYPVAYSEPFIDGWHIAAICYHAQALWEGTLFDANGDVCDTLVINAPPGCSKSRLCCCLFPAWIWLKNPAAGL